MHFWQKYYASIAVSSVHHIRRHIMSLWSFRESCVCQIAPFTGTYPLCNQQVICWDIVWDSENILFTYRPSLNSFSIHWNSCLNLLLLWKSQICDFLNTFSLHLLAFHSKELSLPYLFISFLYLFVFWRTPDSFCT